MPFLKPKEPRTDLPRETLLAETILDKRIKAVERVERETGMSWMMDPWIKFNQSLFVGEDFTDHWIRGFLDTLAHIYIYIHTKIQT